MLISCFMLSVLRLLWQLHNDTQTFVPLHLFPRPYNNGAELSSSSSHSKFKMKFTWWIARAISSGSLKSLKRTVECTMCEWVLLMSLRILNIFHTTMTTTSKLFMFICAFVMSPQCSLFFFIATIILSLVESLKVLRSRMFSYSMLTFIWLHLKSIEMGYNRLERIEKKEVSNYESSTWFVRFFEIIISFSALGALHKRVERVRSWKKCTVIQHFVFESLSLCCLQTATEQQLTRVSVERRWNGWFENENCQQVAKGDEKFSLTANCSSNSSWKSFDFVISCSFSITFTSTRETLRNHPHFSSPTPRFSLPITKLSLAFLRWFHFFIFLLTSISLRPLIHRLLSFMNFSSTHWAYPKSKRNGIKLRLESLKLQWKNEINFPFSLMFNWCRNC